MKAKGLLVILIFAIGIIYLLWFAKTGEKTQLETKVDQYSQAKADLTKTNMQALQKIVISYIASEGQTPQSLQDLQNSKLLAGGAIDAWGKSIKYEKLSDSSFRLISAGKDNIFGTRDDIVLEY
jgi:hypothetical protein